MIEIAYQTDEIIVVNKPCGMSCQGGAGAGVPLETVLQKQLGRRVYLVHRLDRDTAGLVAVALTSEAASKWTRLVASHEVVKEYMAICIGCPKKPSGTITAPIRQRGRHGMEEKDARTEYEVIGVASGYTLAMTGTNPFPHMENEAPRHCERSEATSLSLVRCRILTGRTHQIRIHLSSIGCPIAGDDKHGDFAMNRALRKSCGVRQLCLASVRLTLPDGTVVEVPPPPHMRELITMTDIDILPP